MMACFDCENCTACASYLLDDDLNKPVDVKEINRICKVMGGFKPKQKIGEEESMFNMLKGFFKHEAITHGRTNSNMISLCKSGCFGISRTVLSKYNLQDKKGVVVYYSPSKKDELVLCFKDSVVDGATRLRVKQNGIGMVTAISFINKHKSYIGKYDVVDFQVNAMNGDSFLQLKRAA